MNTFRVFFSQNFSNSCKRSKALLCPLILFISTLATASATAVPAPTIQYTVIVLDKNYDVPLELARVTIRKGTTVVTGRITTTTGRASFADLAGGSYTVNVHYVGYNDVNLDLTLTANRTDTIRLSEVNQSEVVVTGSSEPAISAVDLKTGNQVFESETYHAAPTARMNELVQENLLGAARAPTGEVHVRGQHGEFTYYVDGAPIPLGVFGGLNEVVDPKVIDRATFWTGGFPAEYGGQMAAIVDVQNRVPSGSLHLDLSSYAGSYIVPNKDTLISPNRFLNSNGQSLSISDHVGKLGFFLSGSRQETDRRIDAPVPSIFHDHGFDYFLYGKADYILSDNDFLTLNLNYGVTSTQIPFDSVEQGVVDDHQHTSNSFETLTYYRTLSTQQDAESNFLITAFARQGGLTFTPGTVDMPSFQFAGDTSSSYVLAEDRSFNTIGVRTKYDDRLSHQLQIALGGSFSATSGKENFTSHDAAGVAGPTLASSFVGSDFGLFVQTEWHPVEWTRFDVGVRYDQHIAPDVPLENQVSPRVRWNFLIDDENTAYLYFGKMFMPNNIEGIRTIASNVDSTGQGTLSERDNFYEAVYTHLFDFGVHAKFAYFRKDATPGVDDQTIGSSSIRTPVNIAKVYTQGLELGLSYSSTDNPLSGYLNAALVHAYGAGTISGGFLALDNAGEATDLDHDQRLSVVASLNYQPQNWYVNVTGIYGSGLTNGAEDYVYKTGLFDFNQGAHTTPAWIFNLAAGYTIHLNGGMTLEPSLFVRNLLNHEHLLKGAFFSGASWEEPRNVVVQLAFHV